MDDAQIHSRIEELVAEEHGLWDTQAAGSATDADRQRLADVKVSLTAAGTCSVSGGRSRSSRWTPMWPERAPRRPSRATSSSGDQASRAAPASTSTTGVTVDRLERPSRRCGGCRLPRSPRGAGRSGSAGRASASQDAALRNARVISRVDGLDVAVGLVRPGQDEKVVAEGEVAGGLATVSSKTIQASGAPFAALHRRSPRGA